MPDESQPRQESSARTLLVALLVSVVCALLVSLTAVGLADRQQANRDRDLLKNVLAAAGVDDPDAIDLRIIELESGEYVTSEEIGQGTYDQKAAIEDHELSVDLPREDDIASIGRRENYSYVGLIHDEGQRLAQVILPVRGQGFSSMLRAFVVLDADGTTVQALTVYEQGETPGLGGEITNPDWLASWKGKKVYDDEGAVQIRVGPAAADYQVDALSGATVTSDAMTNLMQFWFGDSGFKVYLEKLRSEGGDGG
jgi:Na+-transporting NADH:ubiquinone oxidoreductase subunit C